MNRGLPFRSSHGCLRGPVAGCLGALLLLSPVSAFPDDTQSDEDRTLGRYESMLLRRPAEGTAFERLFRAHFQRGDVADWLTRLDQLALDQPEATGPLVLKAMVAQRLGERDAAQKALEVALTRQEDLPAALIGLGDLAGQDQQWDQAAHWYEKALAGTLDDRRRLGVQRRLANVYQAADQPARARLIWDNLVQPDDADPDLVEEAAEWYLDRGQMREATELYERLARREGMDAHQRTEWALAALDLHRQAGEWAGVRSGATTLLAGLGEGHWRYRTVLDLLESSYLEVGDSEGLLNWYTERVQAHPELIEDPLRLSRFLEQAGQVDRAEEQLRLLSRRAPHRSEPLLELAALLQRGADPGAATDPLRQLMDRFPAEPLYRERLAQLLARERSAADPVPAASIDLLRELAALDPSRADLAGRAARGLEALDALEAAEALYREALRRDAGDVSRRDDLARFLVRSDRKEEAGELVITGIPESSDPAAAAHRLRAAETLAELGFTAEAVHQVELALAADLVPMDLQLQAGRLLEEVHADRQALDLLDALALRDDTGVFLREIQQRRLRILVRLNLLEERYNAKYADFKEPGDVPPTPVQLLEIAQFAAALGHTDEAKSVAQELVLHPDVNARDWMAAAMLFERLGDLDGQVTALERLLQHDQAASQDVVERLVRAQQRLGKTEQALAIARQRIESHPEHAESFRLLAEVEMLAGQPDQAVMTLRRALRRAPEMTDLWLTLARLERDRGARDAALEAAWQAFRQPREDQARELLIPALVEIALQTGRLPELQIRLERLQAAQRDRVVPTLALAACHRAEGDYEGAREQLLLLKRNRDTERAALRQLVDLAEESGHLEEALDFQRLLAAQQKDPGAWRHLGDLYLDAGMEQEALKAWAQGRLESVRLDPGGMSIEWVDHLQRQGFEQQAGRLLDELAADPNLDWEQIIRIAHLQLKREQYEQVLDTADRLLHLDLETVTMPKTGPLLPDPELGKVPVPAASEKLARMLEWRYLLVEMLQQGGSTSLQTGGQPDSPEALREWSLAAMAFAAERLSTPEEVSRRVRHPDDLLAAYVAMPGMPLLKRTAEARLVKHPEDQFARHALLMEGLDLAIRHSHLEAEKVQVLREHLAVLRESDAACRLYYDWVETMLLKEAGLTREACVLAAPLAGNVLLDFRERMELLQLLKEEGRMDDFRHGVRILADQVGQGGDDPGQQMQRRAIMGWLTRTLAEDGDFAGALEMLEHWRTSIPGTGPGSTRTLTRSAYRLGKSFRFPAANPWWDTTSLSLLQNMYTQAAAVHAVPEMEAQLEQMIHQRTGPSQTPLQLALAYIAWWDQRPGKSESQLKQVLEMEPDQPELRMALAELYSDLHQPEAALRVLESWPESGSNRDLYVHFMRFEQAFLLDRRDVAEAAATHLMRHSLTATQHKDLAEKLVVLDLDELAARAAAVRTRQEQAAPRDAGMPRSVAGLPIQEKARLMDRAHRSKQEEEALRLARAIVRQTAHREFGSSDFHYEGRALNLLRELGHLDQLIEEELARVEDPPQIPQLLRLTRYRLAAEQDEEALQVLETASARYPDDRILILQLARVKQQLDDRSGALDHYLDLMALGPAVLQESQWVNNMAPTLRDTPRAGDVVGVLQEWDAEEVRAILLGSGYVAAKQLPALLQALSRSKHAEADDVLDCLRMVRAEWVPEEHGALYLQTEKMLLEKLDRKVDLFELYAREILGESACRRLGLEPMPETGTGRPPRRGDPMQFLDLAEATGRLPDLAALPWVEDDPDQNGLRILAGLRIGDPKQTALLLDEWGTVDLAAHKDPDLWMQLSFLIVDELIKHQQHDDALRVVTRIQDWAGTTGDVTAYRKALIARAGELHTLGCLDEAVRLLAEQWILEEFGKLPLSVRLDTLLQVAPLLTQWGAYREALVAVHEALQHPGIAGVSHQETQLRRLLQNIYIRGGDRIDPVWVRTTLVAPLERRLERVPREVSVLQNLVLYYRLLGDEEKAELAASRLPASDLKEVPAQARAVADTVGQIRAYLNDPEQTPTPAQLEQLAADLLALADKTDDPREAEKLRRFAVEQWEKTGGLEGRIDTLLKGVGDQGPLATGSLPDAEILADLLDGSDRTRELELLLIRVGADDSTPFRLGVRAAHLHRQRKEVGKFLALGHMLLTQYPVPVLAHHDLFPEMLKAARPSDRINWCHILADHPPRAEMVRDSRVWRRIADLVREGMRASDPESTSAVLALLDSVIRYMPPMISLLETRTAFLLDAAEAARSLDRPDEALRYSAPACLPDHWLKRLGLNPVGRMEPHFLGRTSWASGSLSSALTLMLNDIRRHSGDLPWPAHAMDPRDDDRATDRYLAMLLHLAASPDVTLRPVLQEMIERTPNWEPHMDGQTAGLLDIILAQELVVAEQFREALQVYRRAAPGLDVLDVAARTRLWAALGWARTCQAVGMTDDAVSILVEQVSRIERHLGGSLSDWATLQASSEGLAEMGAYRQAAGVLLRAGIRRDAEGDTLPTDYHIKGAFRNLVRILGRNEDAEIGRETAEQELGEAVLNTPWLEGVQAEFRRLARETR